MRTVRPVRLRSGWMLTIGGERIKRYGGIARCFRLCYKCPGYLRCEPQTGEGTYGCRKEYAFEVQATGQGS